jgi:membrane-associated phospholipid phosphatase
VGTTPGVRRDPKLALLGAFACLYGLLITGAIALLSPAAQAGDATALKGITTLNHGRIAEVATRITHLCDPPMYGLFGAVLVLVALVRRRMRIALVVPVILVGAEVTTEVLKPLLATPRAPDWLQSNIVTASWPSGHSTAALALALCAVLVSPARLRPIVGLLGAVFAAAVAYAILVLAWHFPSDVLGGFLVATLWSLLGVSALLTWEGRRPSLERRPRQGAIWPVELAGAMGAGVLLALLAARPQTVAAFATDHTFALGMLTVIGALALACAGGVVRVLRD